MPPHSFVPSSLHHFFYFSQTPPFFLPPFLPVHPIVLSSFPTSLPTAFLPSLPFRPIFFTSFLHPSSSHSIFPIFLAKHLSPPRPSQVATARVPLVSCRWRCCWRSRGPSVWLCSCFSSSIPLWDASNVCPSFPAGCPAAGGLVGRQSGCVHVQRSPRNRRFPAESRPGWLLVPFPLQSVQNCLLQRTHLASQGFGEWGHNFPKITTTTTTESLHHTETRRVAILRRVVFSQPFHSQQRSVSNFSSSLTRNITPHRMKNLDFHSLFRRRMINLPILTTSLIHFSLKGWDNLLFELALMQLGLTPFATSLPSSASSARRSRAWASRISGWRTSWTAWWWRCWTFSTSPVSTRTIGG